MYIDRILLIYVDLEELIVTLTLEVLVADLDVSTAITLEMCHTSRFTYEFSFWKLA